jgi:ribosome recycling factor
MTKKTNALGEEGKVAVRNVRRDALKALGKLDSASEDIIKVGYSLLTTREFH